MNHHIGYGGSSVWISVNKMAEGEISITFDLDTLGECFQSFQAVTSPEKEKLT